MKKSKKVIIESIVLAILAMVIGSVMANIVTSHILCNISTKDAIANIILDFMIIVSQILVLTFNYKKKWHQNTRIDNVKKNIPLAVGCFGLAGIMVGLSYVVLQKGGIINYLGSGFKFDKRTEVYTFVVILFVRMLIVGIAEELLFRGVLARHMLELWGRKIAVILSTLIFTVFHCMVIQCWSQVTDIFFLGLIFGIIYVKTGSIVCPIAFHFGIDFFTNLVGMRGQVALFLIEAERGESYVVSNLFFAMSICAIVVLLGIWLLRILQKEKE